MSKLYTSVIVSPSGDFLHTTFASTDEMVAADHLQDGGRMVELRWDGPGYRVVPEADRQGLTASYHNAEVGDNFPGSLVLGWEPPARPLQGILTLIGPESNAFLRAVVDGLHRICHCQNESVAKDLAEKGNTFFHVQKTDPSLN